MRKSGICGALLLCATLSGCSSESWFGGDKKLDMPGTRESLVVRSRDLATAHNPESQAQIIPMSVRVAEWNGYYSEMALQGNNMEWDRNITPSKNLSYSSNTYLVRPSLPSIDQSSIVTLSADGTIAYYDKSTLDQKWVNDFFEKEEKTSMFDFVTDRFLVGGIKRDGGVIYASAGLAKVISVSESTGETIWAAQLSSPVRAMPAVYDNVVIFHSIDNKLFALDKATGKTVWTYIANSEEVNPLSVSAPQVVGNRLIIRLNNDEVVALDPVTGEEAWTNALANKGVMGYVSRASLNYDNSMFIAQNFIITTNSFGHVFKIDIATGETLWSKDIASSGKLWVSGNAAFIVSNSNELISLNTDDGSARWVSNINKTDEDGKQIIGFFVAAPILANGYIYVGNNSGELLELDVEKGSIVRKIEIPEATYLPPIFVEGKMYVMSNNGDITIY